MVQRPCSRDCAAVFGFAAQIRNLAIHILQAFSLAKTGIGDTSVLRFQSFDVQRANLVVNRCKFSFLFHII